MLNTNISEVGHSRRVHRPLRVAVLCSHRAPGLMYLLNRSPDRGVSFEIACVMTSERTFDEEVRVERRGIPIVVHPIADFYAARGALLYRDMRTRAEYDAETLARIEPHFPDLIVLAGYLYLVTTPMLTRFGDRIVNLHFSDLTLRRADGGPRFPGIRAVRAAIAAGCAETRATVHLVNEQPDDGAPIVRSWAFPVSTLSHDARMAPQLFGAYVAWHQQSMMQSASGPLLAMALRLIATGAVDLHALACQPCDAGAAWQLGESGELRAPLMQDVALA